MAEAGETDMVKADQQEEDCVIPVFTIIKNNAILKNIYLLHAPTEMGGIVELQSLDESGSEKIEVILTVGRHPDCNIVLSHPSISRFHLRISSKPSARELSVTDLSSVHGTWMRGERIEPRVKIELNEGDELRLGGSSRVYKLHWVPVSQAYDTDHPFCPTNDVMMGDDMEQREDEPYQDESGLVVENVDNSNCKAVDLDVSSEEEVCFQRSAKNDSVIRGILKNRSSQSSIIKPLGLSMPHEETVASAEFRGVGKGDKCDSALAFVEVSSQRGTAQRPTIEFDELLRHDELGSVVLKQTEDNGKLKVLSLLSESCREEPSHPPLCTEVYLHDNCIQDGVPESHVENHIPGK